MSSHRIHVALVALSLSCVTIQACKSPGTSAPSTPDAPVEQADTTPQDPEEHQKGDVEPEGDADEPMTQGVGDARLGRVDTEEGAMFAAGDWSLVDTDGSLLLVARDGGEKTRTLFDLDREKAACQEDSGPEQTGEFRGEARVLFVTETMVGYELDTVADCGGARLDTTHDFFTFDLKTMKPATLLDIAEEADIIRALDTHPLIKQARSDDGLCLSAPNDADISTFAIKRIDHGDVEVAVTLTPAYGACPGAFDVAVLSLPVKSIEVRKALAAAQDAGTLAERLAPKSLDPPDYEP